MSRQMLSASSGSLSRRYRWAFSSAAGMASRDSGLSSYIGGLLRSDLFPEDAQEPLQRIVELVDHPLLQRDDGVVGDGDPLGADLGAVLGDVAVADPLGVLEVPQPVLDVERVHLQRGGVDQQPGADEPVVQVV